MTIRLNDAERDTLVNAGTKLRPVTRKEIRELGRSNRPSRSEQTYMLESDCGNLSIDPETGATACSIYESDEYPRACTALKMGSYSCGLIQLTRVVQGQDTLDRSKSEVLQR